VTEWRETSSGVFYGSKAHFPDAPGLEWLKRQADSVSSRRARWCAHADGADRLQEMLVAVRKDSQLPIHRHLTKPESLIVIEGLASLQTFDDDGKIREVFSLGPPESGRSFHLRIPAGTYHSLKVESEYFIFHEVTLGPWRREDTQEAPWGQRV